jgi:hypothetical protein
VSLEEEEESPVKIKKKEEIHSRKVSKMVSKASTQSPHQRLMSPSVAFQVKKEMSKAANLYPSGDIYRKENVQSPHLIGQKANANFGRTNSNQYQNQLKIKGQPGNVQDGYFQGFYPKHGAPPPNIPLQTNESLFAKHDIEFHQKGIANNPQQFAQFHAAQKYEAHDYEHHTMIKADANPKIPVNNVHARPVEFPQNQMYYNENAAQNPHNQYYPNEFDVGSDGANSGYFDPKSQAHYYDMNYHHQHGGNEYSEMYGPNAAAMNENCENFSSFQQFYEHQQQQQQQQHHQQPQQQPPHQQNMHPHYHHIGQNVPAAYAHQGFNNSQAHPNTNLTDNSNSSSDFNFLSNLNDFAPEYYQLS